MNWPNHTDYQDSIQNPQYCFSEPELKTADIACDMLGLPKVMSGNFASVYEAKTGDSKWAIRCFVRQVSGQQARYTILSKHLSAVQLPSLVKFEYITKGINVRNEWYPIVKMQWVTGVPMHVFVDENYQDSALMTRLAAQWRDLIHGIRSHHIAHGDLQHGNVMVTPEGEFRLVDYDGMYVPGFGRGRSPELGHINYQHLRRTADYYEEALDNFAALIVVTSFLALAKEPSLWSQFSTGDNLLFVGADFQAPQKSKIIERLKQSPDEKVKLLASLIEWCCLRPIATVPDFQETMKAIDEGKLPVDLNAAAAPASVATPNWMSEEPHPASATGSRIAPTDPQGTRSAPPAGTRVVPSGGTRPATSDRPVTTSQWSGSRAADEVPTAPASPPPRPAAHPTDGQGLNLFALAAIALALLAFIPQLRLLSGAASLLAGIVGVIKGSSSNAAMKWVGLDAGFCGAGLAVLGAMDMKKGPAAELNQVEETAESTAVPTPNVAEVSPQPPIKSSSPTPPPASPVAQKPPVVDLKIRTIGTFKAHTKAIDCLAFSHDNQTLASGSADGTVRLWDAQSGELRHTLSGIVDGVYSMTFSPDSKSLFVVGMDNVVTWWNVPDGSLKQTIKDHQKTIWPVTVSPDGTLLASGSGNRKMVKLADIITGAAKSTFVEQASWVRSVDFSSDSKIVATQAFDETVRFWDVLTGQPRQSLTVSSNTVNRVVIAPNSKIAATGIEVTDVALWDVTSGKQIHRLKGHTSEIKSVCFDSKGKYLASGSLDRSIRVWEVASGQSRLSIPAHESAVTALAFSPSGKEFASAGEDKFVKLWDTSSF